MSGRFKRHLSKASTSTGEGGGGGNASGAVARKKRRLENVSSDEEERSFWTPKHLGDLKAYNRSASEAPAELFRKDLISAMKLADNEPLTSDDYWGITDQWKQEWEKGVQVPVNPDSLPEPSVFKTKDYPRTSGDFRLPRRFIRVTHNDFFNNEKHVLSNLPTKAEKMCRYDMDNLDEAWLKAYNGERARMGAEPVPPHIFELIIEQFEETCWENIHKLLKTEETLAIEFDEDVICDVCRSPDREEGNEMVFCDICNICVHQACYGITAIPSGSWLCRTCSLGIKPNCDLCPNKGGAMKSTKSGHKWAHVACALWIPEVSIGSVDRMEPITKITNIPASRWALVCVLCRERRGACIQCSVKSCKTAYHVTCAFKHGLEMKAIIEDENADDVKLRSYCEKHSMNGKKENSDADSDGGVPNPHKKKRDMTNEQKNQARAAKLRQIEAEFFKHVDVLQTSTCLDIDYETTETIFYFWKLKRRAGFNKPLLTPRCQELDLLSQQQEQDIERMKMFVQLRQYLERVRNLCYMVCRRERLSLRFLEMREQTFHKQVALLGDTNLNLNAQETEAIAQANHGHCIYDRIYSHSRAPVHTLKQFESIIRLITKSCKDKTKLSAKAAAAAAAAAGGGGAMGKNVSAKENARKKGIDKDINGLIKNKKKSTTAEIFRNPYRKTYFNGAEERRSRSRSNSIYSSETSSTEDSDSSLASTKWKPPDPGGRVSVFTSSEDEKIICKSSSSNKNTASALRPTTNNNNNSSKSKSLLDFPSSVKGAKAMHETNEETNFKTSRGRGAGRRGRGRPPITRGGGSRSSTCNKENALLSSEEDKPTSSPKDSKMFDALIRTTTSRTLRRESSSFSPVKEEDSKIFADSSDEEEERRKPVSRVARGRGLKKTPVKQEVLSSSEEDVPRPKRGKGRGRGRGSSRKHAAAIAANTLQPWPFSKFSDEDDNLGPAIYKLTSEEDEKSDKSAVGNEAPASRRDLFGTSSRSEASDSGSPVKKETKSIRRSSESERNESEDAAKESEEESLGHSHLKTKAAMKEFTPKIEAKVEKLKRRGDKSAKVSSSSSSKCSSSSSTDRIKAEVKSTKAETSQDGTIPSSKESSKVDSEPAHDLTLFVPQRAAAKKASELITSQNTTGGTTVNQISCHSAPTSQETPEKKQPLKTPSLTKESVESESSLPPPEEASKKAPTQPRSRRGRSSKERQEEQQQHHHQQQQQQQALPPQHQQHKVELKSEAKEDSPSEPPKKNIFEPPEILPYVPIREAARKAAENIKGSGTKTAAGVAAVPAVTEDTDNSTPAASTPSVTTTPTKQKKSSKAEVKAAVPRSSRTKMPRNSSKIVSAESESEEEIEAVAALLPSVQKRVPKEAALPSTDIRSEKGRSIFSESEDEAQVLPKKDKLVQEKGVEAEKDLPNKQQLFRGDIFVRDHQSSSENDEEDKEREEKGHAKASSGADTVATSSARGRESSLKTSMPKDDIQQPPTKDDGNKGKSHHSFRSSRDLTRLFGADDPVDDGHEAENEEPPAETRRKAPDKKLKTSDGRPEHGFQPPITQRDESGTPIDKPAHKIVGAKPPVEEDESRLRESGAKCRPGAAGSDLSHEDVRSDAYAPHTVEEQGESITEEPAAPTTPPPPPAAAAAAAPPPAILRSIAGRERELAEDERGREEPPKRKETRESDSRSQPDRGKIQFEEPVECQQPKTSKATPEKGFKSTFECISPSVQEEKALVRKSEEQQQQLHHPANKVSSSIFNFIEKDLEVKRLEDIEETSDPEPEPKKVKITDSDEDTLSLVDRKVEQPKDSGYKSAIATPEPVEKTHSVCNDHESSPHNTVINDPLPLDINLSLKKTRRQQLSSPTHYKSNSTRYTSPVRKKNLEDVIEERKKIAEQSEYVSASLLEKKAELARPLPSSPAPEIESNSCYAEPPESIGESAEVNQLPISGNSSTGSTVCSTSSAPSSFVEEWREQWDKSPQSQTMQMEHMDPQASFPALGHHPGLTSLNEFPYTFLDTNFSRYFSSRFNIMQLALLRQQQQQQQQQQQYAIPQKTHDTRLEEEANHKTDITSRLPSRDDGRPFAPLGEHLSNRIVDQQPPPPILQHEVKPTSSDPAPKAESRHLGDNKSSPSTLPSTSESALPPCSSHDSLKLSSTPASSQSCSSAFPPTTLHDTDNRSETLSISVAKASPTDSENTRLSVSPAACVALPPTSTVTNTCSKLSSLPTVSSAEPQHLQTAALQSPSKQLLPSSPSSWERKSETTKVENLATKPLRSPPVSAAVSTKSVTTTSVTTSVISSTSKTTTTCDVSVLKMSSPIPSVISPAATPKKEAPPTSSPPPAISTVDTAVLHSPPQKRIPIYMQEPKTPKVFEKRSPRALPSSPRWSGAKEKRERKSSSRSGRGKGSRGRGTAKGKRRGGSTRYNSVSVPKELVGTVYEFDDEFDDDGPANNALDDLRMLREKRQSIEVAPPPPPPPPPVPPQPSFTPPTYVNETKDQPPKKRVKEKKVKAAHKDRTPKREEVDEVAKILEEYKNQQNSKLKRSVHEPSPPQVGSLPELKKHSSPRVENSLEDPLSLEDTKAFSKPTSTSSSSEDRKKQDSVKAGGELSVSCLTTPTVVTSSLPEDRTNQLKLKIKGPYANSYLSSALSAPPSEASVNPIPPSTTTTLRRMRKKELIQQYCYQDNMNTDQVDSSSVSHSSNPPQQLRMGITLPKAVASMTSIPTREDYKMYTQDDSTSRSGNSSRRRRQPRELKHLDWTLLDDSKGKRNSETNQDSGRKRARAAKDNQKPAQEEKEPNLLVTTGKLRISIGKKAPSDVAQVTSVPPVETRDMGSKGKPPKKRHEDLFSQVMSESLKFREEIMAEFDKQGGKTPAGEKKSRKRKFGHAGTEGGAASPMNSELKEEGSDGSQKIVLKISKGKSESGGSGTEDRGPPSNTPPPHPLKIRLSLASLGKSDGSDSNREKETNSPRPPSGERILPLKIKLQRRPEGYVTSKSRVKEEGPLDQGPGPPPEPPDPPSGPTPPPPAMLRCNDASAIEHKDREALLPPPDRPGVVIPPHSNGSKISEDVLQCLEAKLAAPDGELPLPLVPPDNSTSFSAMQPLPPIKDESGCR